jgi:anaerobic selenocysteine-containing dehydrogenase/Fe-S-cluster-containing dehydrogenase component
MNRRDFLKALGLGTGVTAAQACTIDDNVYYTPIEQVVPYVTRPEQTTPGTFTAFATTVGYGPYAWPATASHREGRVVNVGANRAAPVAPAVTGAHFLALQRHWSPDRVTAPTQDGAALAWDKAVEQLAAAAAKARQGGKKVAWIGPYRSGSLAELLDAATDGNAVHFEPFGLDAEAAAASALFGADAGLPRFVLDEATFVLSFGAPFLSDVWGNPGIRSGYSAARTATANRSACRFAAVTPLKDQTSANADDWYACAPGSEALVALAVAKLVADARGYSGPGAGMLGAANVDAAVTASGLSADAIRELAGRFGEGAVALPGGLAGASGAGSKLAAAVYLLNHVSRSPGMRSGGYAGPVHSRADVEKLVEQMKAGKIGLLLVDDLDVDSVAPGLGFAAALATVDVVASVSSWKNETNKDIKLVLPTHDALEDWGDEEPWAGMTVLRQPGALPVGDTRSLGDLLLAVWRAVEPGLAPAQSWRDWLWTRWLTPPEPEMAAAPDAPPAPPEDGEGRKRRRKGRRGERGAEAPTAPADEPPPASIPMVDLTSFAARQQLQLLLQRGYVTTDERSRRAELVGSMDLSGGADSEGDGPYHLQVFAHPFKLDGRFANEPWANETPDPMTGQVWDIWALVHSETAKSLGVGDNDLLVVEANGGSIRVGVEVHDCVARGVLAIPLGGGRTTASGRYADGVGEGHRLLRPAGSPATYRFGLTVDTNACTGCGACGHRLLRARTTSRSSAAEKVVGKGRCREMGGSASTGTSTATSGDDDPLRADDVPAVRPRPCESVCPVLATYHTIDGLNAMVYNRCVGTRYCSNACPYSVRRFNYHTYAWPEPFNLQLNPDVTARTMGVMEKCTFCVQRSAGEEASRTAYRELHRTRCRTRRCGSSPRAPRRARPGAHVRQPERRAVGARSRKSGRNYDPLTDLNTFPAVNYLAKASFHVTRRPVTVVGTPRRWPRRARARTAKGTEAPAPTAHGAPTDPHVSDSRQRTPWPSCRPSIRTTRPARIAPPATARRTGTSSGCCSSRTRCGWWRCWLPPLPCSGAAGAGSSRSSGAWASPGTTRRSMWGVYIVTFVFWVGIGHAGTLISAILFLVRSRWRTGRVPRVRGHDRVRRHDRAAVPGAPPRPRAGRCTGSSRTRTSATCG